MMVQIFFVNTRIFFSESRVVITMVCLDSSCKTSITSLCLMVILPLAIILKVIFFGIEGW
jgi:hypothetical protein